jgi:hypothetical protein
VYVVSVVRIRFVDHRGAHSLTGACYGRVRDDTAVKESIALFPRRDAVTGYLAPLCTIGFDWGQIA